MTAGTWPRTEHRHAGRTILGWVKPTPLESVLESILPLGFSSDVAEAPYGAKGTCFLVKRRGVVWVVTAKHAIGEQTGYARIPRNADSVEWLELGYTSTIDAAPGTEDSAAADLTVIRVLSSGVDIAPAVDLDHLALTREATTGDRVFMAGFPAGGLSNEIRYEAPVVNIQRQRFQVEAAYVRPDTSKHMHIVQMGALGHVTSMDGMSGSPVLLKHGDYFGFAGVLTRAGTGAFCLARFVEADLLVSLLETAFARTGAT